MREVDTARRLILSFVDRQFDAVRKYIDAIERGIVRDIDNKFNSLQDFVDAGKKPRGIEPHLLWIGGGLIFIAGLFVGYVLG